MLNTRAAGLGPYACQGLHGQGLAVLKMPAAAPLGRACWKYPTGLWQQPPSAPASSASSCSSRGWCFYPHSHHHGGNRCSGDPSDLIICPHQSPWAPCCLIYHRCAPTQGPLLPFLQIKLQPSVLEHTGHLFHSSPAQHCLYPSPCLNFLVQSNQLHTNCTDVLLVPKRSSSCGVALMARTLCMLSICGMDTDLLYVVPSAMDALSCSPLGEPP